MCQNKKHEFDQHTKGGHFCAAHKGLNYSIEAGIGNQAYRSGIGPILSEVSVVVSEIRRGLVVQSGDWSVGRTGVGRGQRDLSVGASGIQRRYSGC